jgi:hypothetical protein
MHCPCICEKLPSTEQSRSAPVLRDEDGHWTADYVRLRFITTA